MPLAAGLASRGERATSGVKLIPEAAAAAGLSQLSDLKAGPLSQADPGQPAAARGPSPSRLPPLRPPGSEAEPPAAKKPAGSNPV